MPKCPNCGYTESGKEGFAGVDTDFWPESGVGLITCPRCDCILGGLTHS